MDILFGGRERNNISKDASTFLFEIYLNDDFSKFQNHFRFMQKLHLLVQLLVYPSPVSPTANILLHCDVFVTTKESTFVHYY